MDPYGPYGTQRLPSSMFEDYTVINSYQNPSLRIILKLNHIRLLLEVKVYSLIKGFGSPWVAVPYKLPQVESGQDLLGYGFRVLGFRG